MQSPVTGSWCLRVKWYTRLFFVPRAIFIPLGLYDGTKSILRKIIISDSSIASLCLIPWRASRVAKLRICSGDIGKEKSRQQCPVHRVIFNHTQNSSNPHRNNPNRSNNPKNPSKRPKGLGIGHYWSGTNDTPRRRPSYLNALGRGCGVIPDLDVTYQHIWGETSPGTESNSWPKCLGRTGVFFVPRGGERPKSRSAPPPTPRS